MEKLRIKDCFISAIVAYYGVVFRLFVFAIALMVPSDATSYFQGSVVQRKNDLTVLMILKYLVLLYGARIRNIDTSRISGLDQRLLAEVLSKRISFQRLRDTFPRFSMLVKSKQVEQYSGFIGTFNFVIDTIQWNIYLCKTLWIPNERTKMVEQINNNLNLSIDDYSIEEIEPSVNKNIDDIYQILQQLNGSLSRRSQKWVEEFVLFYRMWVHLNSLIEEVRNVF